MAAGKPIGWSNIADGRVQPHCIVIVNKAFDNSNAVRLGKRTAWPKAIGFEALVPSLDFSVTLRVKGRGLDMGQAGQADKLCTSPEKTDTKINLSVTSYEFGPCEESVHLEADTTLGFNLLFFSFFFEKVLLCASQVASYPFGV